MVCLRSSTVDSQFSRSVDWVSRTNNGHREFSDLTACDYIFLLGWAKEEVHRSEPRTLDELEQQIRDTCAAVSVVLLKEKC